MKDFLLKYNTESDFKKFIDELNDKDVLMEFAYELYMKYGKNTMEITSLYVNAEILDIDELISYFEDIGDFEKCDKLVKIKND